MGEFIDETRFARRLHEVLAMKNRLISLLGGEPVDEKALFDEYRRPTPTESGLSSPKPTSWFRMQFTVGSGSSSKAPRALTSTSIPAHTRTY